MKGNTEIINARSVSVFCSGLVMVFLFTGSFKANGVLFLDTVTELHSSNFLVGSAYVLQAAVAFSIAGIAGAALEEVSNRVLGITGGFLFGLGFICYGLLGSKLWHLFVFMAISAIGGGLLHISMFMAYLEHFREKFPVAFSARELSTYIGVSVMPPLMEVFRSEYGLHGSFVLLGSISWNSIVCGLQLVPAVMTGTSEPRRDFKDKLFFKRLYRQDDLVDTGRDKTWINSIRKFLTKLSHPSVRNHPNFGIFLVIHSVFYYSFTGWALFLVPFGRSLGYQSDHAVYLSTAGGIGGFCGKALAIVIFYINRMNIISGSFYPSCALCIGLLGYILSENYFLLMSSSFLCGFAIAYADSALNGMIPWYLCKYHLRQGSCISYIYAGLFMQCGGSVSGAILDVTSSYTWVFATMVILQVYIGIMAVILHLRSSEVVECLDVSEHSDK